MQWKAVGAVSILWALAGAAAAVGNMAEVTVYDRAENRALPLLRHAGRYYVVGKPGNEYQVRVRNRTGADILAVLSVDGVNAVSGETASWHQAGYVLAPHQTLDVKGWRKSLQRVAVFFFTEHHNSYAASTGRPENVGVIGVALYRKKREPEARIDPTPPRGHGAPAAEDGAGDAAPTGRSGAAESAAPRHAPSPYPAERSAALGTGHGRSETSHARYTAFERATAHPEEVIAIHYDTYSNLVALGVIRAPRVATPFPGQFVPDPK
jgi:hypothetical protein